MRYVIIGQKDSTDLLVVDTETMTVSSVDSQSIAEEIDDLRAQGVLRGVDFAIATDTRDLAPARWFYP
jgi:hypothetical protein